MSFADADEAPRRDAHCQAVDELAASESLYHPVDTTTVTFDCASGLVSDAPLPLDKVALEPIAGEAGRPEAHQTADLEGQRICTRLAERPATSGLREG